MHMKKKLLGIALLGGAVFAAAKMHEKMAGKHDEGANGEDGAAMPQPVEKALHSLKELKEKVMPSTSKACGKKPEDDGMTVTQLLEKYGDDTFTGDECEAYLKRKKEYKRVDLPTFILLRSASNYKNSGGNGESK